ncbi:short-chain dehydrogenase, partial [Pseudomonas sp. F1002]|nr:short-chain dehydrogenase [Pseudomonas sp. F1002]
TPARDFAVDVLKAVQQGTPPRLLRSGNGCRALPLMAALLPKGLLETVLKKRFGLSGQL